MKKLISILLSAVVLFRLSPVLHAASVQTFAIEPQYEYVHSFSEGLAAVMINGKYGYIDKTGRVVLPPQYEAPQAFPFYGNDLDFHDGLAFVKKDGKNGFINKTGNFAIQLRDHYIADIFHEGLALVEKDGKYGFIDKTGKVVIQPKFENAWSFSDGLAYVVFNRKEEGGFIDKTGKIVIQSQSLYDFGAFREGLAQYGEDNKVGFMDKTGKVIIPAKYDSAGGFTDGVARVEVGMKSGLIDKTGKEVVKPQYSQLDDFSDGLAFAKKNDKYLFIDKTGKEVIRQSNDNYVLYSDHGSHFSDGLALVAQKYPEKYGFIDKTGKDVIKPKFDAVQSFSEGLAAVEIDGKWGFIASPLVLSEWAKPEVDIAVSLKLVPEELKSGYNVTISRAEFCKLVTTFLTVKTGKSIETILAGNGKTINKTAFRDTRDTTILAANALGIVTGKSSGTFDPNGDITRQEAAVMLARTAKLLGTKANNKGELFADSTDVASWAKEAVAFVSSVEDKTNRAKVMGGTGNKQFSPYQSYTRQQAFITMKRLFQAD